MNIDVQLCSLRKFNKKGVVFLPGIALDNPLGTFTTFIRSQAMNKPVVAYDSGGVKEALLPNETGFSVNMGNVKALAEKIEFLLKNQTERLRMGERGREFVCRQFSVSALVQRHEAFYLDALRRWPDR